MNDVSKWIEPEFNRAALVTIDAQRYALDGSPKFTANGWAEPQSIGVNMLTAKKYPP